MFEQIFSYFSPKPVDIPDPELSLDEDLVTCLATRQSLPSMTLKISVGDFPASEKVVSKIAHILDKDGVYHLNPDETREGIAGAIVWMESQESEVSTMDVDTVITLMEWGIKVHCIKLNIQDGDNIKALLTYTFNGSLHSETIEQLMVYCYYNEVMMEYEIPPNQYINFVTRKEKTLTLQSKDATILKFLRFAIHNLPRILRHNAYISKTIALWLLVIMKSSPDYDDDIDSLKSSFYSIL